MDSTLVVCYSYTGNSLRLAQLLCSHRGWPLGQISDVQPRAGSSGTLRCMMDSWFRRSPEIRYEGPDPADFQTIVLVTPVWLYRMAGPMRAFVKKHKNQLRRIAVITTMNAGGATNVFGEISDIVGVMPVLMRSFTSREIDTGEFNGRLEDVGDRLLPDSAPRPAWKPAQEAVS